MLVGWECVLENAGPKSACSKAQVLHPCPAPIRQLQLRLALTRFFIYSALVKGSKLPWVRTPKVAASRYWAGYVRWIGSWPCARRSQQHPTWCETPCIPLHVCPSAYMQMVVHIQAGKQMSRRERQRAMARSFNGTGGAIRTLARQQASHLQGLLDGVELFCGCTGHGIKTKTSHVLILPDVACRYNRRGCRVAHCTGLSACHTSLAPLEHPVGACVGSGGNVPSGDAIGRKAALGTLSRCLRQLDQGPP
jgi:hypothetical protein